GNRRSSPQTATAPTYPRSRAGSEMSLVGDILRALRQVGDRRFLGVLIKALVLTLLLLVVLTWIAVWAASGIPTDLGEWWLLGQVSLPGIGPESLAVGFVLIASVFLMIP